MQFEMYSKNKLHAEFQRQYENSVYALIIFFIDKQLQALKSK